MTTSDRMTEMFRRLRIEMNGAVSGAMSERGLNYALNYGVSFVTIKSIATKYAPDHDLALLLYKQDIREMKIAAIYVDEPSKVTANQIREWVAASPSDEITEHLAMGLFFKTECDILPELLAGDYKSQKCALHIIGKRCAMGTITEVQVRELLPFMPQRNSPAAVYAFTKIATFCGADHIVDPQLKAEVLSLLG